MPSFWKSEPQYAYKSYACIKKHVVDCITSIDFFMTVMRRSNCSVFSSIHQKDLSLCQCLDMDNTTSRSKFGKVTCPNWHHVNPFYALQRCIL